MSLGGASRCAAGAGIASWRWRTSTTARDAYASPRWSLHGQQRPARGGEVLKIGILGTRSSSRRREILGSVVAERLLDAVVLA
jgi:hypothetical protein